jgi:probable phosphoglycerate mutase
VSEQEYPQTDYSRPPEAIEIVLVRHGASQAAVEGQPFELLEGQADPPLAEEGRHQALRVAMHLADEPMDQLFVTPLCRTAQTATPLAAMTGFEPVVVPELREVHLGELDGGAFRIAVDAGDPRVDEVFAKQRWDVIPGAESNDRFATRVRAGLERIVAAHRGQRVVVVVHGGVIGQAMALASGASTFSFLGADNASITQLVAMPEPWVVRRFNDTAHLDPTFALVPTPLT